MSEPIERNPTPVQSPPPGIVPRDASEDADVARMHVLVQRLGEVDCPRVLAEYLRLRRSRRSVA